MKIGILGSGEVAKTPAGGFLRHGHKPMLGTRTPAELTDWAAGNQHSAVGSFAQAAEFGELAALAVKGTLAADALHAAGAANL